MWRHVTIVLVAFASVALVSEPRSADAASGITGAVDLSVSGESLRAKTGPEILTIAKDTKFVSEGRMEQKTEKGKIEYVPREYIANAIPEAIGQGLLAYKFTIEGTPPKEFRGLKSGTYYVFVQMIDGRWVAEVVNQRGAVSCELFGVRVRQEIVVGNTSGADHQHHRPEIMTHKIPSAAEQAWVEYHAGWEPFGSGCIHTTLCVPAG
jgi:hypothetical protein